jgi:glycine cleavage system aminomethyltransferase T
MATETLPGLDAQYRVMREGAGLLERSGLGKLLVRGGDAAEFLQGQLTNEVEALGEGQGAYAALLDRKGHIQADLRLLRLADGFWLDTEAAALAPLCKHLETYKIGREVEVLDRTAEEAIVSVIGPQAWAVAGADPGEEYAHLEATPGGVRCRVVATDLGVDCILPAPDSAALTGALLDAGAARVSEAAAEILRVERGRPRFGTEMGPEAMPAEAGIVAALSRSADTRSRVSSEAGLPSGVTITIVRSPCSFWIGADTVATPGTSPTSLATVSANSCWSARATPGALTTTVSWPLKPGPNASVRMS